MQHHVLHTVHLRHQVVLLTVVRVLHHVVVTVPVKVIVVQQTVHLRHQVVLLTVVKVQQHVLLTVVKV